MIVARTLCRLASTFDARMLADVLTKRAKKERLDLESTSVGSLCSFRVSHDGCEESVSSDGEFLVLSVESGYPVAYCAQKRPLLLSWMLDADLMPATEKPFCYHDREPFLLTEDNRNTIVPLLDGLEPFLMPIVYVPFGCIEDASALQEDLRGLAHVVYEGSLETGKAMDAFWLSDGPDENTICIFSPFSGMETVDLSRFVSDRERMNVVVHALYCLLGKDTRFAYLCWDFISADSQEEPEEKSSPVEELIPEIEKEESASDGMAAMIAVLKEELASERQAKHRAQLDAMRWKSLYESKPGDDGRINLMCSEKDLYLGECHDAILHLVDARIRELESGESDVQKMRYYDILKAIQRENEKNGEGERLRKDIEDAMLEDSIPALRNSMKKLGFDDVTATGHLRFNFCHDQRYTLVMATTPSDRAARKNASSSKVMKHFFPF